MVTTAARQAADGGKVAVERLYFSQVTPLSVTFAIAPPAPTPFEAAPSETSPASCVPSQFTSANTVSVPLVDGLAVRSAPVLESARTCTGMVLFCWKRYFT